MSPSKEMSSSALEEYAKEYIPAEIFMFSGCRDEQTSSDVSNVKQFNLPDPAGKAGGVCTTALLEVLYNEENATSPSTFQEIIEKMRFILKKSGYSQIPQFSSSRPIDVQERKFTIVPTNNFSGRRYAVIIGINYTGMQGELSGCQNDCNNMIKYIKKIHGFQDENITILMDDDHHTSPTKKNILDTFRTLVKQCKAGDAVFCHFAGHGGLVKDDDGDEDDGYDETLIPVDYQAAGQIVDDDLFKTLVAPMPAGVTMTCVIDCCHSGTALDLPFIFLGTGEKDQKMYENVRFGHTKTQEKGKSFIDNIDAFLQRHALLIFAVFPILVIIYNLFFNEF